MSKAFQFASCAILEKLANLSAPVIAISGRSQTVDRPCAVGPEDRDSQTSLLAQSQPEIVMFGKKKGEAGQFTAFGSLEKIYCSRNDNQTFLYLLVCFL